MPSTGLMMAVRPRRSSAARTPGDYSQVGSDQPNPEAAREAAGVRRLVTTRQPTVRRRAADARQTEFLAQVTHELRTPLTCILGFVDLLDLGDRSEQDREWIAMIKKAGLHLNSLLDDISDITRFQGSASMILESVRISEVLGDAIQLAEPLASSSNIRLSPVPVDCESVCVKADRQRLTQVLLNLLSNAVKYNSPLGEVRISLERPVPDRIRLCVSDTGNGIDGGALTRLFTPFERLEAAATGIEGTGLGLALSRDLARAMGGDMGASSRVDVGSTFWVELAAAAAAPIEPADDAISLLGRRRYRRSARILYVEDTVAYLRLVQGVLALRPGVVLIPSMLGGLALDLAREHQPDLVLLDMTLPDIDGAEVLRRLKADRRTRSIPVIVLTAEGSQSSVGAMLAAGAVDYLRKPIGVRRLLEVLDAVLGPAPGADA